MPYNIAFLFVNLFCLGGVFTAKYLNPALGAAQGIGTIYPLFMLLLGFGCSAYALMLNHLESQSGRAAWFDYLAVRYACEVVSHIAPVFSVFWGVLLSTQY